MITVHEWPLSQFRLRGADVPAVWRPLLGNQEDFVTLDAARFTDPALRLTSAAFRDRYRSL